VIPESAAGTRNYVSGIEYLGANLDAIYHAEGRCTPNGASAFHYEYTLKDHLGNARVNFRANGAAITFLQELHYYPFGLIMEGIGTAKVTDNAYKYNGKELNEDLGLNLSDYGARWYDAALGRWWSVDPMGEAQVSYSSYAYVYNNPMAFIDPTGMIGEGADGLTNDQWLESSRPNNQGKSSNDYRKENRDKDVDEMRKKEGNNTTNEEDEQGRSSYFKKIAESLNKAYAATKAGLATDAGLNLDNGDGKSPQSSQIISDKKILDEFAKAVKLADPKNSGTIKIWIDPWIYQNTKSLAGKKIPELLRMGQNDSGLPINRGVFNVFLSIQDAFNANGIKIGNGSGEMKVSIWIKPLNNQSATSQLRATFVIWSPSIPPRA